MAEATQTVTASPATMHAAKLERRRHQNHTAKAAKIVSGQNARTSAYIASIAVAFGHEIETIGDESCRGRKLHMGVFQRRV